MNKLFLSTVLLLISVLSFAQSHVKVRAYFKKDGTYVPSYYRTSKDNTVNNNWSTVGNYNPYTGKAGTLPRSSYSSYSYKSPRSYTPSYSTSSYSAPVYMPSDRPISYRYTNPSYSEPTYAPSISSTLYTGPRGGVYYINSSGNKSYVRK